MEPCFDFHIHRHDDATPACAAPRRKRSRSAAAAGALLLAAATATALLPEPAAAAESDGFLYGRLETTADKAYTGILRWGDEEAFWDDLFNSGKVELPHASSTSSDPKKARTVEVFGKKLTFRWGDNVASRHFVTRFGDIARLEPIDGKVRLSMRGGSEIIVAGSSNDVTATVEVRDATIGTVQVPWKRIKSVEFQQAPKDVELPGFRLAGTVRTTAGTFEGFVQWDKQECLSIDKLDGDEDGIRLSLPMGNIRTIERHSRAASRVTLQDGRTMILDGTNDVDDSNRGILVEDERFGRVEVPWSAFERVEFRRDAGSGRAYSEFGKYGELQGRVSANGKTRTGRIVFDLDEAYGWEMLDGFKDDIAYSIPFGMVARIEPRGTRSALVRLKNGQELVLSDTQDVTDDNDGILVFEGSGDPVHIPWDAVGWIELD
ncbi:MAG TPA: hypothetical protein VNB06_15500 [Thermoanaerobaculia bacterium]|nr:hypothetical protein [Thermoanaerobaculia bacterium]